MRSEGPAILLYQGSPFVKKLTFKVQLLMQFNVVKFLILPMSLQQGDVNKLSAGVEFYTFLFSVFRIKLSQ